MQNRLSGALAEGDEKTDDGFAMSKHTRANG